MHYQKKSVPNDSVPVRAPCCAGESRCRREWLRFSSVMKLAPCVKSCFAKASYYGSINDTEEVFDACFFCSVPREVDPCESI